MENPHEHIAEMMYRFLRNELSGEQEQRFLELLEKQPAYKAALESFRNGREAKKELEFIHGLNVDEAWKKVAPRPASCKRRKPAVWAAAAAVVFVLLSAFWVWRYQQPDIQNEHPRLSENTILPARDQAQLILSDGRTVELNDKQDLREVDGTAIKDKQGMLTYAAAGSDTSKALLFNTLKVPRSGTYRIMLPDGSIVWLNANSELRFPVHFPRHERFVQLKGEAYFEVAKDSKRPFKVRTGETEIEVLGTHFNVRAYGGDPVATTLVEGSVKVQYARESVMLIPGQQARSEENTILVEKGNLKKVLAWKENLFYFKEDRITDIMQEISRWYDVDVVYTGAVPRQRYTGSIRRNATLREVLDLISFTSSVTYRIEGRRVHMDY